LGRFPVVAASSLFRARSLVWDTRNHGVSAVVMRQQ